MQNHRFVPLLTAALLIFAVPSGLAGHTDDDRDVTFEHKTGNEWWVEVVLGGADAESVTGVDARDTNGDWIALEKNSWGAWAASFHIEPGNLVQFRAHVDGQTETSCWFTHPEGQETCTGSWHKTQIDRVGEEVLADGPLAADVYGDGEQELVVATSDGLNIYAFDGGWQLEETVARGEGFTLPHVADLDGDGRIEIVVEANTFDAEFVTFEYDGTWQRMTYDGPADGGSAFAAGDADGDGMDAVYIASHGDYVPVYEVRLVDGAWEEQEITKVVEGVDVLHIGDGDGDGEPELYVGGGYKGDDSLFQVKKSGGTWTKTQIGIEHGTSSVFDIGIGDADGDGRNEVYHTTADIGEPYALWRNTFDGTWSQERVASFGDPPYAVEVADGDNDGTDEVYVGVRGQADHRILETQPADSGWSKERIAVLDGGGNPFLASGDVDRDGLVELYAAEQRQNGFVHEVSQHPPGSGDSISATFNSRNGNEWWVQVHVSEANPTRVQAQDTGDPWKELELKDWGGWAASYHVEPGHDVRYRAMVDGGWVVSCWFTHPEGKAPDGSETCTTGTSAPSDFDASFDTPGGNEWWVEVYVEADEPLAGVDARDDGDQWIALEKKDWGAWAKSFHVEDGSIVEFRATSTDGDTKISQGYRWPSGDPA